jgi:transcriptional regulator with XRE-family HTH domain
MTRNHKAPANLPAWAKRLTAARMMVTDNQTDFAKSVGMSQQRYNNYEQGLREPKISTWKIIRTKLGVPVDFIMFGDIAIRSLPEQPRQRETTIAFNQPSPSAPEETPDSF